jgi:uncharacterized protein YjbI with pentapeptide repeats
MADSVHLAITQAGPEALRNWRAEHPGLRLDFSNANLTGKNFEGYDLRNSKFSGANLTRITASNANFDDADLSNVNLNQAMLAGARLNRCDFFSANLQDAVCNNAGFEGAKLLNTQLAGTNFENATLNQAKVTGSNLHQAKLQHANLQQMDLVEFDFSNCDLSRTRFHNSDLAGAKFRNSQLQGAGFQNANLSNAIFDNSIMDGADLTSATLTNASLYFVSLRNATLVEVKFQGAILSQVDFYESYVDFASFDKARGVTKARNLHTVRFRNDVSDVRYFDYVVIPILERAISWERIRFLGRLPLFAASYTALIVIPFLYYFLDVYNRKIDVIRNWAESEINNQGQYISGARAIIDYLHREPIPSLSLLLLISTFSLGIGATIFSLACPARVREFSRDQWRDELRHSLIHYLPFAWRYRWLRLVCVICYLLGGIGVTFVLGSKLWNVLWFIIDNR